MGKSLTDRQAEVLRVLQAVRDDGKPVPSVRELAVLLGRTRPIKYQSVVLLLERIRRALGLNDRWPWVEGPAPCVHCQELEAEVERLNRLLQLGRAG